MIFFGHLGLTLAVTRTADKITINRKHTDRIMGIDYRVVLVGSLLPDIIDKSILFFISGEKFKTGRLYAHSLLFALILFIIGIAVWYAYKKSLGIILAACSFVHLILDNMWSQLKVFLWPVYAFLPLEISKSLQVWSQHFVKTTAAKQTAESSSVLIQILTDPYLFITEIVGVFILMYFFLDLVKKKQIVRFLKSGKLK